MAWRRALFFIRSSSSSIAALSTSLHTNACSPLCRRPLISARPSFVAHFPPSSRLLLHNSAILRFAISPKDPQNTPDDETRNTLKKRRIQKPAAAVDEDEKKERVMQRMSEQEQTRMGEKKQPWMFEQEQLRMSEQERSRMGEQEQLFTSETEQQKVQRLVEDLQQPVLDSLNEEQQEALRQTQIRERQRKAARNMKYTGYGFGLVLAVGSGVLIFLYGQAPVIGEDEFGNSFSIKRAYHGINGALTTMAKPVRESLLQPPLPPPHQPKYTLVLEIKNILVHPEWTYTSGWRWKKRPAVDYFLNVVGYPNFEVVIYTSETYPTMTPIMQSIDPKQQRCMYFLGRECTQYMAEGKGFRAWLAYYTGGGHYVKALDHLRRDMSKVIMIDWDPKAVQFNPENALLVPAWNGDMDDSELIDLAELLKTIYVSGVEDVRPTLQHYSASPNPAKEFRRRAEELRQEQEQGHLHKEQQPSLVSQYAGKLFGFRRHA